jgi:hypothetical protein
MIFGNSLNAHITSFTAKGHRGVKRMSHVRIAEMIRVLVWRATTFFENVDYHLL